MASLRYMIPALAIAGGAAAASCSVDSTTTIQNAGDAKALATCTTFSGSIAVATGTVDNIDLSGIQDITGSLTADSAQMLPGIVSSSLQTIGGTFSLANLSVLSTLTMPELTKVKSIDWNGLPGLQTLTFGTNGVQMASNLAVQNTHLDALSGINLQTVDTVLIANNIFLTEVNMQLANITNNMTVHDNGQGLSITLPNLIWANGLDLSNATTISMPSLAAINQSMYVRSDYFTSFAGPNVTTVGGDLTVVDCPKLTNLSFPQLTTIGAALTVANNTALTAINAFPKLSSIQGALDFTGNFTNASLPSIKTIVGTFNVQSTSDITSSCNTFQSQHDSSNGQIAQGKYYCNGTIAHPSTTTGGDGTSSGSTSSTPSHTGAANALQLPAVTGVLAVVAAIFGLF